MKSTTKTAKYWRSNCKSVSKGVRYNTSTKTYYIRKGGKYIGSATSMKSARAMYNSN